METEPIVFEYGGYPVMGPIPHERVVTRAERVRPDYVVAPREIASLLEWEGEDEW